VVDQFFVVALQARSHDALHMMVQHVVERVTAPAQNTKPIQSVSVAHGAPQRHLSRPTLHAAKSNYPCITKFRDNPKARRTYSKNSFNTSWIAPDFTNSCRAPSLFALRRTAMNSTICPHAHNISTMSHNYHHPIDACHNPAPLYPATIASNFPHP
jgi:hypothetical protein